MKCAPRNKINLVPFNVESFLTDTIPNYLEVEADSWDPSTQFKYLRDHLSAIDTKCLVFEEMYKDRHFISEHTLYYSTCHNVYPNFCHRVHAFGVEINIEEFETALCGQGQDEENNTSRLCKNYLGFIVIRPVPAAHIGRTVLKPYDDNPDRKFTATRMYRVHLVGLDLKVDGLAFQQQDRRVGACATYAIWSALQKASYESGLRTPTPGEISESATRYHIFSRPYPA